MFGNEEYDLADIKEDGCNEVNLSVNKNILTMDVGKNLKGYKWVLPTKFRANYIEEDREKYKEKGRFIFGDSTTIPFRNSYGMIGFRAYGEEQAVLKDIVITKL